MGSRLQLSALAEAVVAVRAVSEAERDEWFARAAAASDAGAFVASLTGFIVAGVLG